MVSLFDLLTAVCFATPVGGALASAKYARVGFAGYVLAVIIGLTIGFGCAWTMHAAGKASVARLRQSSQSALERYAWTIYAAAIFWIAFALFLGGWTTSAAVKFAF